MLYHISEDKSRMTEGHMLQEAVYLPTGEAAPGACQFLPQFSLLGCIIIVQKVEHNTRRLGVTVS